MTKVVKHDAPAVKSRWQIGLGVCCWLVALAWLLMPAPLAPLPVLRVGTTGDYPPFTLQLPNGTYTGTDITAARQFARDKQYQLVLVPTTWKTWVSDLSAQRFDVAMGGINITPQRQKQVRFTVPVAIGGKAIVHHCAYPIPSQLNQSVAVLLTNTGGTNQTFVQQHYPKASMVWVEDNTQLFATLLNHPSYIVITDAHEARYHAALHPKLCVGKVLLSHHAMAYAVAPSNNQLLNQLNLWLSKQAKH